MNMHENARRTPIGRAELFRRVMAGETTRAVAAAFGVDAKTVRKRV